MSTFDKIPKDKRNAETELIAQDADRYSALYAAATSKGGKILIESLKQDIVAGVDKITVGYATLPEGELRAVCAALGINRSLVQSLTRSKDNFEGALDALDELIA